MKLEDSWTGNRFQNNRKTSRDAISKSNEPKSIKTWMDSLLTENNDDYGSNDNKIFFFGQWFQEMTNEVDRMIEMTNKPGKTSTTSTAGQQHTESTPEIDKNENKDDDDEIETLDELADRLADKCLEGDFQQAALLFYNAFVKRGNELVDEDDDDDLSDDDDEGFSSDLPDYSDSSSDDYDYDS